jgi:MYXO-CTERM domain-containing protein
MKVKPFALAGLAGTMILTGAASAAFTGIKKELYVGEGWVENGYAGLVTYRIYANFDGMDDDGVLSVFGVAGLPMNMYSTDGLFSNSPVGLDSLTAPQDLRFLGIWQNQWDTYVTIGTDNAQGDATTTSPGFAAETNSLASDWTTENGGWFVTPDDAQSIAVEKPSGGLGVLLAQITLAEGQHVNGFINLLLRDGTERHQLEIMPMPTPGALALLGLAGLAGGRRRRH